MRDKIRTRDPHISDVIRDFGGKSWVHNGCRKLLTFIRGSFKQGTRHYIYIYIIVNIIEELKWKYNYGKS